MGVVSYDVPLVTQEQNPICWVSCMAMVASYWNGCSIGVAQYANGWDPSNSSIANPADGGGFYRRLKRCGFTPFTIDPKVVELEAALKFNGPLILSHYCKGFPYGPDHDAVTDPRAQHSVVITGIDTDNHVAWMNNPWGDLDQSIQISAIIYSVKRWNGLGWLPFANYGS